MSFTRKRLATAAAAVALAGLVAGCSGGGGGGADQTLDPANPVAITVGTLPAGDYAPLYIAEQEGYFEEEGLDVTIEIIAGGAVGMTQLYSGDLDFSSATWTNVLLANSQGFDIQVVREGTDSNKEGINGLIVQADGPIEEVEDLRGETLSVNTLGSATELQIRDCLATEGLEPGDYELVEVAFPDAAAAVSQGRIAAGFVPEPFITIGSDQGLEPLFYASTCNDVQRTLPLINWTTSESYANDNPAVVAAFKRAMDRATELAIEDPQVVVDILPTFTTLTPELAEQIVHPSFVEDGTPNLDAAQITMDLMIQYGLITEPLDDLAQYAWTPPSE
ncbi:sulfonate ABC transporter substrate-binding protein [Pseudoclavibacter endophyticus]|uniref:ABC transporter substrate-binding protein n=1 Tax=Pseudoclavibacter endophyticus TaxID=1778590 RepID=A0A6H9WFV0_9MICO|nr:ABC transporter substrate-binding protein [Pseudoclavibacter endophyticus]KAB1647804.1 ABC transporter substrate-binding protein [Pseudoclavibacter endophyticus]GGA72959.1 sulfonate ABC transporter substrate-binding protein [Pseudoclavibacter endophyticus]